MRKLLWIASIVHRVNQENFAMVDKNTGLKAWRKLMTFNYIIIIQYPGMIKHFWCQENNYDFARQLNWVIFLLIKTPMKWILYFKCAFHKCNQVWWWWCHDKEMLQHDWYFLVTSSFPIQMVSNVISGDLYIVNLNKLCEWTSELSVIWNAMMLMWHHCIEIVTQKQHFQISEYYPSHQCKSLGRIYDWEKLMQSDTIQGTWWQVCMLGKRTVLKKNVTKVEINEYQNAVKC